MTLYHVDLGADLDTATLQVAGSGPIIEAIDDDVSLSADSDIRISTQHAIKTYADNAISSATFIGLTDTPSSYSSSNRLISTNTSSDGLIETAASLTTPSANRMIIQLGTASADIQAAIAMTANSTIDQDLSTSANVLHGSIIGTDFIKSLDRLEAGNGLILGKTIGGGKWWFVYQIANFTNDHLSLSIETKDIDTNVMCKKDFYAGAGPSIASIDLAHSVVSGLSANQPRIISFNSGEGTETIEINYLGVQAFTATYASIPRWQSFTTITGKHISRVSALNSYLDTAVNAVVRIYSGQGTSGTLLGTSNPISGNASGTIHFVFPTPIAVSASSIYSAEWSCDSAIAANLRGSSGDGYPGGRFDGAPNWDIFFRVYTIAFDNPSRQDIYIFAQPEAASLSYVTIRAANVHPIWEDQGNSAWPTGHPIGANIYFDSDDAATYPPNNAMKIGEITVYGSIIAKDSSKELEIIAGGSSSKTTLTSLQSSNRTIYLPDASDTLIGKDTIDILRNKTLTDASNDCRALTLATSVGDVSLAASPAASNRLYLIATGTNSAGWLQPTLADLEDGFGAPSAGNAIIKTNALATAIEESSTTIDRPAANQLRFVEGSTTITFLTSGSFDQALSTGNSVSFANVSITSYPTASTHAATKNYVDYSCPIGYIYGYDIELSSSTLIVIGKIGQISIARDDLGIIPMTINGTLNLSTAISGPGGLQTGSTLATSQWLAIYVIGDSTGTNSVNTLFIPESIAFSESGYDLKRRIGWIRTSATTPIALPSMFVNGNGSIRSYRFGVDVTSAAHPNIILNGGRATTFTTIDLSTKIPPTSREAIVTMAIIDNDPADETFVMRPSGTAMTIGESPFRIRSGGPLYCSMEYRIPTDSNRRIQYAVTSNLISGNAYVVGFSDEI